MPIAPGGGRWRFQPTALVQSAFPAILPVSNLHAFERFHMGIALLAFSGLFQGLSSFTRTLRAASPSGRTWPPGVVGTHPGLPDPGRFTNGQKAQPPGAHLACSACGRKRPPLGLRRPHGDFRSHGRCLRRAGPPGRPRGGTSPPLTGMPGLRSGMLFLHAPRRQAPQKHPSLEPHTSAWRSIADLRQGTMEG